MMLALGRNEPKSYGGGTVSPEVSWVGPGAEGWEAQKSCLDPMRWQQGTSHQESGRDRSNSNTWRGGPCSAGWK